MMQVLARSGPLGVLVCLFAVSLVWLTVARSALLAMHWPRVADVADIWRIFPIGIRMDTIVLCELFAIPTVLYFLLPGTRAFQRLVAVAFASIGALLVHMELSTPSFIAEYDTRPNQIYFEYLRYPREVFGTLLKSYPLQLFGVTILVVILTVAFYRFGARRMAVAHKWTWRSRALCLPLVIVVMFIGARSTFGHRPANLSTASFSENHLANELAVSSTYSLLNAIYMHLHEVGAQMYGHMEWPEIERRVQRYAEQTDPRNKRRTSSMANTQLSSTPGLSSPAARPPNLVIFVVESLG